MKVEDRLEVTCNKREGPSSGNYLSFENNLRKKNFTVKVASNEKPRRQTRAKQCIGNIGTKGTETGEKNILLEENLQWKGQGWKIYRNYTEQKKTASSARSRLVSCSSSNTGREQGCVRETCRSPSSHFQRWHSCQELGSRPWLTSSFYSGHQGSVNRKHQALIRQWVVQRHSCPLSAIHWDVGNIFSQRKWGKSLWTPESASQLHNSSTARIFR